MGPRICIMGPSNSGKSTLAAAISRRRGLPAVHLDQLYHQPHTDWLPRPAAEFLRLHDASIQAPRWVMEGNYSRCLPQRLARATGFILLETGTATSLLRYLRRCWSGRQAGRLEGANDRVTWQMIRHIAVATPPKRLQYAAWFDRIELPKACFSSTRQLDRFYRAEGLSRR
jgi:adenylate kinase family enzyme